MHDATTTRGGRPRRNHYEKRERKTNVGAQFQAHVPPRRPIADAADAPSSPLPDDDALSNQQTDTILWQPIPPNAIGGGGGRNSTLDCFIRQAKEIDDSFDEMIALAVLQYCRSRRSSASNVDEAVVDEALETLRNRVAVGTLKTWTLEQRLTFDQAIKLKGKDFRKINELLPKKSLAELIEYYYLGYKAARKGRRKSSGGANKSDEMVADETSANGGAQSGRGRASSRALKTERDGRSDRIGCEFGAHDMLDAYERNAETDEVRAMESEMAVVGALKQLQIEEERLREQYLSTVQERHVVPDPSKDDASTTPSSRTAADVHRRPDPTAGTGNTWSDEERKLAILGAYQYGRDHRKISKLLGGRKSESQVMNFFFNFRHRFNLEKVIERGATTRRVLHERRVAERQQQCKAMVEPMVVDVVETSGNEATAPAEA